LAARRRQRGGFLEPGMPRTRTALAACGLTLAAGCGSWTHPTKSGTDFYAEKMVCEQRAATIYPVVLVQRMVSAGHRTPTKTDCTQDGKRSTCITTPGSYVPPQFTTDDVNETKRSSAIDDCLKAGGWTWKLD
jgi:hypothetical protein